MTERLYRMKSCTKYRAEEGPTPILCSLDAQKKASRCKQGFFIIQIILPYERLFVWDEIMNKISSKRVFTKFHNIPSYTKMVYAGMKYK